MHESHSRTWSIHILKLSVQFLLFRNRKLLRNSRCRVAHFDSVYAHVCNEESRSDKRISLSQLCPHGCQLEHVPDQTRYRQVARLWVKVFEILSFSWKLIFRCNLKLCSKHDYSAVNATKFVADELQIAEIPSRMSDEKVLKRGNFQNINSRFQTIIRVKIDTFTIWFIGKDDVTKVDRAWGNGEILEEWSVVRQENRRDIAIRFLEKICWRGTFEAKKIYMNLVSSNDHEDFIFRFQLSLEPLKNWKLKCDWLRISSCSPENSPSLTLQWLRKVDCQLKKLVADDVARLDVADVPHVLDVTETLHLENCDISDEHLEQITAADVFIRSETLSLNAAMRNVEVIVIRLIKCNHEVFLSDSWNTAERTIRFGFFLRRVDGEDSKRTRFRWVLSSGISLKTSLMNIC